MELIDDIPNVSNDAFAEFHTQEPCALGGIQSSREALDMRADWNGCAA